MKDQSLIQAIVIAMTSGSGIIAMLSLDKLILNQEIWRNDFLFLYLGIGAFVMSCVLLFLCVRKEDGFLWRAFASHN